MALSVREVVDANLCSGCGLCASVLKKAGADMRLTPPGYLRPVLPAAITPEQDALLAAVCPGSRVQLPETLRTEPGIAEWGPVREFRTGYATDPALRHNASSGGALSAILEHLLASRTVDFVVQISADPATAWLNRTGVSAGSEDVRTAAGSRYAPSAPLSAILEHLDGGKPFAVVGKPCDIAALRAYAGHDARVGRLIPAMIAFMCGGIPSETGIRALIRKMGADPADVTRFRFRGDGWPGRAKAQLRSGGDVSISYAESWGGVLSKHVQLRCKICADGTGMSADIVCADAWYGGESGYPSFEEQEGRSMVLLRTGRGMEIADGAVAAGYLQLEPLDPAAIQLMQPSQLRRTRLTLCRLMAMRLAGRRVTRFTGQSLLPFARNAGVRANLRNFLGALYRTLQGRL